MTTVASRVRNTRTATVWPVLVGVGLLAGVTAAGEPSWAELRADTSADR